MRSTSYEPDERCTGCDSFCTDCRARLGPCCPDCSCAPPPGPPPHRRCSGSCNATNDAHPCAFCPCPACSRWFPLADDEASLAQWRVEVLAVERVYVCEAQPCGHRWLETTSPAYCRSIGGGCKVCGARRGGVIMAGFSTPLPSDRFIRHPDDGLSPKF